VRRVDVVDLVRLSQPRHACHGFHLLLLAYLSWQVTYEKLRINGFVYSGPGQVGLASAVF
jgi:hypothetical protein